MYVEQTNLLNGANNFFSELIYILSTSRSIEFALGGGGTPLYGLYRYVRPQRVGFFSQGIDFGHFAAILVINRISIFAL